MRYSTQHFQSLISCVPSDCSIRCNLKRVLTFLLVIVVQSMLFPGQGQALTASDNVNTSQSFGSCSITLFAEAASGTAYVRDNASSIGFRWAGGSFWNGFGKVPRPYSITAASVATCLGTTTANITNFTARGADRSSYATQDYMGFAFRLQTAVGSFAAGWHEYKVGGGTLIVQPPAVTSVSVPADATYIAGNNLDFTVNTSKNVTVNTGGGIPWIDLTIGATTRQASYVSGSGSSSLVFRYNVQTGDEDTDGVAPGTVVVVNGATLRDTDGNNLETALTNIGATTGVKVDAIAPSGYSANLDSDLVNASSANSQSFTFAGAEVGASFSYTISSSGGGSNVTGTGTIASATDQISGLNFTGLGDGTLNLSVTLQDAAGNTGSAATDTAAIDQTAPAGPAAPTLDVASNTGATTDNLTSDSTPRINGTAEANATIKVFIGGNLVGTTTADGAGKWSFDVSAALQSGDNSITATATDAAGNVSPPSQALVITIDTATPGVVLSSGAQAQSSGAFTVTITFTKSVIGLTADDLTVAGATKGTLSGSGSVYTIDVTPTSDGTVTVDLAAGVASDDAGNGNTAAAQLSLTSDLTAPTVVITGPAGVVTENATIRFAFSETVTGFEANDITVTNGTKGNFTELTAGLVYTMQVTPQKGQDVSVAIAAGMVNDMAGNANTASNQFVFSSGSPASEFDTHRDNIRQVIVDDASRSLRSAIMSDQKMTRTARERLEAARQSEAGVSVTRNAAPFDISGHLNVSNSKLSAFGSFFGQIGADDVLGQTFVLGDFDIQHDGDTGSTTATLQGRLAWEQTISDDTLLGYFIGGQLAYSDLKGALSGKQDSLGISAGGYFVSNFAENLYIDAFVSVGVGRNNLNLSNDNLELTSNYRTRTALIGGAVSGIYSFGKYDLRPEMSFTLGKTWIGGVNFTGQAFGQVDDTLSIDAGNTTIGSLTLRPEIVWALDSGTVASSNAQIHFAPRLICERLIGMTDTKSCGRGAEFALTSRSENGLNNAEIRVILDRVGAGTRSSLAMQIAHRF